MRMIIDFASPVTLQNASIQFQLPLKEGEIHGITQ
ncbi:hypothetical protein JNUCC1_01119 [Lentibacillus sp. JNUCC-1]|nr:hypothetical protein [Lentibacillus sp. JNUCC-1]